MENPSCRRSGRDYIEEEFVMTQYQAELYHHGIKGQRWGIRRYQNPDGSYTSEGKARRSSENSSAKKAS